MRCLAISVSVLAAIWLSPSGGYADSEVFVDGLLMVDDQLITHENDRNTTGEPVYVHLPGLAPGSGSSISSAAAVEGGTISDLTLQTLSLKSRASLGAATTTEQIWLRGQARLDTSFEILAAGEQTISVGWNGHLHATGDAYAQYRLQIGFNPWNGVYDALDQGDFVNASTGTDTVVDEERTLTFNFEADDVGDTHYLQVYLTTIAAMSYGGTTTAGAYADFFDSFSVTGWSGGLLSEDGLVINPPVPGDFDGDGNCDGADFLAWQRDPAVAALSEWESNYGAPSLRAALRSVPEPASALLMVVVALGLVAYSRED